jgi:hypothetical protein
MVRMKLECRLSTIAVFLSYYFTTVRMKLQAQTQDSSGIVRLKSLLGEEGGDAESGNLRNIFKSVFN